RRARRHANYRREALLCLDRRGVGGPATEAMNAPTQRQRAIAKALTALLPGAPYADTEPIRALALARKMRDLPPSIAVWLATITHIRHVHTDYDRLLEEDYDRDSARFFVIDRINEVLTAWRATRLLDADDEDE